MKVESISKKAIKGLQWTYLATFSIALFQIIYTSTMARLLQPSAFGLMAMGHVVIKFGSYFAGMGLAKAIIQKEEIHERHIRAGFTFSVALGITLSLITWFIAPLLEYVYNTKEIVPIVRSLAAIWLMSGFSAVSMGLLKRELNFNTIAKIEIASYILAYFVVALPLAYFDFGVWSLVAAALVQRLSFAILTIISSRHSKKLLISWSAVKPLLGYGSQTSAIGILEFVSATLDTFFIGRYLGSRVLGIYNRGLFLVQLPVNYLILNVQKVLFPTLSKFQTNIKQLNKIFIKAISIVSFLIIPTGLGISIAAKQIILVMLGNEYLEATVVVQLLGIVFPIKIITSFSGVICDSTSHLKEKLVLSLLYLVCLTIGFYYSLAFGLSGIIIAMLVAESLRHVAYIFITKRILYFELLELIKAYLPGVITAIITSIAIYGTTWICNALDFHALSTLILQMVSGGCFLLLMLFAKPNTHIKKYIFENILNITNNSFIKNLLSKIGLSKPD